jgi:hypothetical protein
MRSNSPHRPSELRRSSVVLVVLATLVAGAAMRVRINGYSEPGTVALAPESAEPELPSQTTAAKGRRWLTPVRFGGSFVAAAGVIAYVFFSMRAQASPEWLTGFVIIALMIINVVWAVAVTGGSMRQALRAYIPLSLWILSVGLLYTHPRGQDVDDLILALWAGAVIEMARGLGDAASAIGEPQAGCEQVVGSPPV